MGIYSYDSKEEMISSRNAFYNSVYDEFVKTKAKSKKSDIVLYVEGFTLLENSLCERAWVEVNGQVTETKAKLYEKFKFFPIEKFNKERCEKLVKSTYSTFPLFTLDNSTQMKFHNFLMKYIQENPSVDYDFDKHYYNLNALKINHIAQLQLLEEAIDILVEENDITPFDFDILKKMILDFLFKNKRLNQQDENFNDQLNTLEALIECSEDPEFADYFYCLSFKFLQPILMELLNCHRKVNYSAQYLFEW